MIFWLNPIDGPEIHWGAQKLASVAERRVVSAKKLHILDQNRHGHIGYKRQPHFGMVYALPVLIELMDWRPDLKVRRRKAMGVGRNHRVKTRDYVHGIRLVDIEKASEQKRVLP